MTADGVKTLPELSPAVKAILEQHELPEETAGDYRFTVERPCHGCPFRILARHKDEKEPAVIGVIDGSGAVADATQPIVFYEKGGFLNGIEILDLRSRQVKRIALPTGGGVFATEPLAVRREQNGFLLAYSTRDACVPGPNPDGSPSCVLRFNPDPLQPQELRPMRICFVRIPDEK